MKKNSNIGLKIGILVVILIVVAVGTVGIMKHRNSEVNLSSVASTTLQTEEAQVMLGGVEEIEEGNSYIQISLADGTYNYALCNADNEMVLESDNGGLIVYRSDNKVILVGENEVQIEPEITPLTIIKQIVKIADKYNNPSGVGQAGECYVTVSPMETTEEDEGSEVLMYRAVVSGKERVREIYDIAGSDEYTDSYINDLYTPIPAADTTTSDAESGGADVEGTEDVSAESAEENGNSSETTNAIEYNFDNIYIDMVIIDGTVSQIGCGTGYTHEGSEDIDEQYSFIIESYYPVMDWSLTDDFYSDDTSDLEAWKNLLESFMSDISEQLSSSMQEQGLVTEDEILDAVGDETTVVTSDGTEVSE